MKDNSKNPLFFFVTGKGGVGKTSVAAALSRALSHRGLRTLYIEWGRNNQASLIWDRRIRPYQRVEVENGLSVFRLVPEHAMEEYLKVRLKTRLLYWPLLRSKVWQGFSRIIPALKEAVVIGKMWFMVNEQEEFSDVEAFVFDGPSTGNAMAMLEVPYRMKEAFVIGPMRGEAQKMIDLIESPQTTYIVVTYGEDLAVEECLEFVEFIKPRKFKVVFNRNYEMDLSEKNVKEFDEKTRTVAWRIFQYYSFRKKLIQEHLERLLNLKPLILPNVFEEYEKRKVIEVLTEKIKEEKLWQNSK